MYKPEESNTIALSCNCDKTEIMIREIKDKGNLGDINELKLFIEIVDDRIEYYAEKLFRQRFLLGVFIVTLTVLIAGFSG